MNISAKVEYACAAALELAVHYEDDHPLQARRIAESYQIPLPFLVQILVQLKSARLVQSTRGSCGGYRLARDPLEISLSDVTQAMDGQWMGSSQSALGKTNAPTVAALKLTWQDVASAQRQILESTTLAELAEQVRVDTGTMYYI